MQYPLNMRDMEVHLTNPNPGVMIHINKQNNNHHPLQMIIKMIPIIKNTINMNLKDHQINIKKILNRKNKQ